MGRIKRIRRVVSVISSERVQVSIQPPAALPASAGAQLVVAGQWLAALASTPDLAAMRSELIAIGERLIALGIACQ